ncbi:hypothetical protein FRZ44_18960 [Hypericibacter terrae]|jgi:hypothetical protein|uniref:Uncharacterized protein n=1 Tax=Hypericibacter terrae TaxID=2602015 RepID=A0A5J6MHN6_9PROT|nr:hypothetical protein [Hypericibacter terrae]QEX16601.1 hypothetical protein FRZ44_18960 [Hypericibacter terrae]
MSSKISPPKDLRKITEDVEMAKAKEALSRSDTLANAERELREEFMQKDLRPDVHERVETALRRAAEMGMTSVKVMEFPATYCTDSGRAINNAEPDWPKSLQGWAERAYKFFQKELAPNDFHLRAEIVDFDSAGRPAHVAIYLAW